MPDINLPEELVYLLKLQLEEADLIALNKIDLLDEPTIERYMGFLHKGVPRHSRDEDLGQGQDRHS